MAVSPLIPWFNNAFGTYVRGLEQALLTQWIRDIFGFYALQIGLPQTNYLAESRINNLFYLLPTAEAEPLPQPYPAPSLYAVPEAMPFPNNSLDLIVLPHTLEYCQDPLAVIDEVNRILIPNGRVIVCGFNPYSLWSWRRHLSQLSGSRSHKSFLPTSRLISLAQLTRLFQVQHYGLQQSRLLGYQWPLAKTLGNPPNLKGKIEKAGERWAPGSGVVYVAELVKQVHSARLVGLTESARHYLGVLKPSFRPPSPQRSPQRPFDSG